MLFKSVNMYGKYIKTQSIGIKNKCLFLGMMGDVGIR